GRFKPICDFDWAWPKRCDRAAVEALNPHADLMFELVSRRYQNRSTLITTNRPLAEWREVFPNAACVVSLIDRLIHNAEIIAIEGESYRLKEARERTEQRSRQRRGAKGGDSP